ncbi:MAG: CBS domain-containing protein [gamma proteobacterium symbiont of Bathyaustriella thionipta]|nr:CBS domain-containing protein [gamma proteobacterium symbiont of Bathyaustriella thionipta]
MKKPRRAGFSGCLKNLSKCLSGQPDCEPQNKDDIARFLLKARNKALLDSEALSMMEGVMAVSELRARDIMIPRAQMVAIRRDDRLQDIIPVMVESAHSRFPVTGDDRGAVTGILLAKDLLSHVAEQDSPHFNMRDLLRPAVFIPESKRLNVLLKEFKASRNHMAVVIDEYGAASGLVTIEDVLEQIVGEIEDEHDFDEGATILKRSATEFTLKALTPLEDFNEYFNTCLQASDCDTIGGYVSKMLGRLPKDGEELKIDHLRFQVLRADSRKIQLLNLYIDEKTKS